MTSSFGDKMEYVLFKMEAKNILNMNTVSLENINIINTIKHITYVDKKN